MKVYNGDGIILGRLATRVAKDVLLGEEVKVVNCEKIIVSGNKTAVLAHEVRRWTRGGYPPKKTNHSRHLHNHRLCGDAGSIQSIDWCAKFKIFSL